MSKKKGARRRSMSGGTPSPATVAPVDRNSRRLISPIIAMAAMVIAVAVWLGLHPSSVASGVESSEPSQNAEAKSGDDQASRTASGGPSIHFPEPSFDFGTIAQGAKVTHKFVVQNIGDEPLKLIRAKGS